MSDTSSQNINIQELITLTHELADISAKQILPLFRTEMEIVDKAGAGNFDPVTQADRNAEQAIREKLAEVAPDHGIIGEEFGIKQATPNVGPPMHWVLDPIDGTRGFMSGFPTWGTLIGLLQDSKPLIGMMNQPFTGERYWSWTESVSAFYTGPDGKKQLKTRSCKSLDQAIMSTTATDMFKTADQQHIFNTIEQQTRLIRYSGDCYAYCLLASGHLDLVIEAGLKIYDIAPLIPIIESAGGIITSWDGAPVTNGGDVIACGDPDLHEIVLKIIQESSGA